MLEQKGLTASVHYRTAPTERWDEIAQIARQVVAATRIALFCRQAIGSGKSGRASPGTKAKP